MPPQPQITLSYHSMQEVSVSCITSLTYKFPDSGFLSAQNKNRHIFRRAGPAVFSIDTGAQKLLPIMNRAQGLSKPSNGVLPIMKRAQALSKPSNGVLGVLHRGSWTPEEDRILKKYIEANGVGRWSTLPQKAGLMRRGKSCRMRWMNHLRPNVKRGPISPDEEELIIRLHNLLGNRWSLIAGRLPGRTDNEVKNHWNTRLSKKLGSTSENLARSLSERQIATASPRTGVDNNVAVDLNSELAYVKFTPHLRSPTGSSVVLEEARSDITLSSLECNNGNDRGTAVEKDDIVHLAPLDVAQTNPCTGVPPTEEIDQCTVQEDGFVQQNYEIDSLNKEQGPDSFLTPYNTCFDYFPCFNYSLEMDDLFLSYC